MTVLEFVSAGKRASGGCSGVGGRGSGRQGGSHTEDIFSSLYSLSTSLLTTPQLPPPRHPLSKGNDLAETLLFRGTLRLEPGAGQKWGVMIKVFATRSQKWSLWLIGSFQEQLRYLLCQIEGYKR